MASRRLPAAIALTALVVVPALAGCGKDKKESAGSSAVTVRATDTECEIDRKALDAGSTTFAVSNKGSKTTEVYVYGADGEQKFTKVVSEVENIGPGTARDMKVDLAAGNYEIACKPGQTGDGIRAGIVVTGAGGPEAKKADREVAFTAVDFTFKDLSSLAVKTGETVKFAMVNKGPAEHEFEVLLADGNALGEIGPTKAGKPGDVTLTFATAGTYTYVCDVDDHKGRGMTGTFLVG